jgi:predicted nucleotidyltransferase
MKPSIALHGHRDAILQIVERNRACNARVFGSVALGCDRDDSDLDILVDPTPETTLFDLGAIRHELRQLLGVPVDVLTPGALPDSFRASVLAAAVEILDRDFLEHQRFAVVPPSTPLAGPQPSLSVPGASALRLSDRKDELNDSSCILSLR